MDYMNYMNDAHLYLVSIDRSKDKVSYTPIRTLEANCTYGLYETPEVHAVFQLQGETKPLKTLVSPAATDEEILSVLMEDAYESNKYV